MASVSGVVTKQAASVGSGKDEEIKEMSLRGESDGGTFKK